MSERDDEVPQDVLAEIQKEMALREEAARGFHATEMDELRSSLKELQLATNDEGRERAREKVYEHFSEIQRQEMGHLDFILDKHMKDEFTYPYDSRQGAVWFMVMRREAEDALSIDPKKGGFDGESRLWLLSLHDAIVWGDGNYSMEEGLNMLPFYYGALDGMASGLPGMKERITATNLDEAYSRDLRGSGSTHECGKELRVRRGAAKEVKTETVQIGFDKEGNPKLKEQRYVVREVENVENMREIGINYQDDFLHWRNLVAATAQYDYVRSDTPSLVDRSLLRKDWELRFITTLFGAKKEDGSLDTRTYRGVEVPKSILNFYTMKDTNRNRAEYRHLMQALLETSARERLGELYTTPVVVDDPEDTLEKRLASFIDEVLAKKNEIEEREKIRKVSFFDRMANIAIRQGITFDVGSANSGPMAWEWEYFTDRKGNVRRIQSFGGINAAGDWYTPEFPWSHNFLYDIRARKRTGVFKATPNAYRKKNVEDKSPFEKPMYSLEEARLVDPWSYNEVFKIIAADDEEILVSGDDPDLVKYLNGQLSQRELDAMRGAGRVMEAGVWREQNGLRIENDVRLALKDILWFQEIPSADRRAKNQLFACFIPHRFKLSFLDQVVDKSGVIPTTLGDKLRSGMLLSEADWKGIREYQWDWWLVNLNMAERWARFISEPGDPRRSEELFAGLGSIKELIKRVDLASRGWFYVIQPDPSHPEIKKVVGPSVLIFGVVGQMPLLYDSSAGEKGVGFDLFSEAIEDEKNQAAWEAQIANRVFMAEYMPPDQGDSDEVPMYFNETISLIAAVTGNNLYKIALEGGTNETADKVKANNRIKSMLAKRARLVKRRQT